MKLKKSLLIFCFLFFVSVFFYSINKPVLRTGVNSYGYYSLYNEESVYPTTLKDNFYFVFEERFSKVFQAKHRVDYYYTNYNKYSENLGNLRSVIISNSINLVFNITKKNEVQLLTKPVYYYYGGEKYFKLLNKIQYKFSVDNFTFKLSYGNQYEFRDKELFYHNVSVLFYWSPKKANFIKFKSYLTVYMNHSINDNEKKVFPVKSAHINMEIAFDFNKIDFENFFEKKDDNEFFPYEILP